MPVIFRLAPMFALGAVFLAACSTVEASAQTGEVAPEPTLSTVIEGIGLGYLPTETSSTCRGDFCAVTIVTGLRLQFHVPADLKYFGANCRGAHLERAGNFAPAEIDFAERTNDATEFRFASTTCPGRSVVVTLIGLARSDELVAALSGWSVCVVADGRTYNCAQPLGEAVISRRREIEAILAPGD